MSQTEVQLIKDAVIVNADVSGSAAIDVSKISGAMPSAGGSFTNDVTFTGASANIVFDKSDNALEFADQAEARFGGNNDLRLYHDGHSIIRNDESGAAFFIASHETIIANTAFSESQAKFFQNGTVELYYDNSKKFETTSGGVTVTGKIFADSLDMGDDERVLLGTSDDLQVYHDGSNSYLKAVSSGTGDLYIFADGKNIYLRPKSGEDGIKVIPDGAVELYFNNSLRLSTTANGVTLGHNLLLDNATNAGRDVTWDPANDQLQWKDDTKATFGNGSDLRIYHDGSSSYLSNTTGNLYIESKAGETAIQIIPDGAVDLRFDGSKKFETHDVGNIITQASSGVANGSLKINTTLDNYGSIIVRNQSHSNSTIGALEVENNADGTNETNFVIRSVNLGSTAWSHAWYAAKSHRFAIEGNVNATPMVQVDLDGLKFNGDQASANALDDYEEGTWTPTASNFTKAQNYSATYTKIGNVVYVQMYITAASGSGTSAVSIGGLPFASKGSLYYSYAAGRIGGGTNAQNDIVFQFNQSSTTVTPFVADGNINEGMISGQHLIMSGFYHAA